MHPPHHHATCTRIPTNPRPLAPHPCQYCLLPTLYSFESATSSPNLHADSNQPNPTGSQSFPALPLNVHLITFLQPRHHPTCTRIPTNPTPLAPNPFYYCLLPTFYSIASATSSRNLHAYSNQPKPTGSQSLPLLPLTYTLLPSICHVITQPARGFQPTQPHWLPILSCIASYLHLITYHQPRHNATCTRIPTNPTPLAPHPCHYCLLPTSYSLSSATSSPNLHANFNQPKPTCSPPLPLLPLTYILLPFIRHVITQPAREFQPTQAHWLPNLASIASYLHFVPFHPPRHHPTCTRIPTNPSPLAPQPCQYCLLPTLCSLPSATSSPNLHADSNQPNPTGSPPLPVLPLTYTLLTCIRHVITKPARGLQPTQLHWLPTLPSIASYLQITHLHPPRHHATCTRIPTNPTPLAAHPCQYCLLPTSYSLSSATSSPNLHANSNQPNPTGSPPLPVLPLTYILLPFIRHVITQPAREFQPTQAHWPPTLASIASYLHLVTFHQPRHHATCTRIPTNPTLLEPHHP